MKLKDRISRWLGLVVVNHRLTELETEFKELRRQLGIVRSVQNRKDRRAMERRTHNVRSAFFRPESGTSTIDPSITRTTGETD